MGMNNPQSEAIRVMGEVIAAQATHIEKLEAGHWSKHTRNRVHRARRELAALTGPQPGQASEAEAAVREATYAERIAHLPTVEVPPWKDDLVEELNAMGRCYTRHELAPRVHMDTPHPKAMCPAKGGRIPEEGMFGPDTVQVELSPGRFIENVSPEPHLHMFDKGGELPSGLVEYYNTTDKPIMIEDCNATRQAREALHEDTAEAGLDPDLNTFKDISEYPVVEHNALHSPGKDPECRRCQLDQHGIVALMAHHGATDQAERMFRNQLATGNPFTSAEPTYDPDTDDQP